MRWIGKVVAQAKLAQVIDERLRERAFDKDVDVPRRRPPERAVVLSRVRIARSGHRGRVQVDAGAVAKEMQRLHPAQPETGQPMADFHRDEGAFGGRS